MLLDYSPDMIYFFCIFPAGRFFSNRMTKTNMAEGNWMIPETAKGICSEFGQRMKCWHLQTDNSCFTLLQYILSL